jgi:hypothetical protein
MTKFLGIKAKIQSSYFFGYILIFKNIRLKH